jgi:hypothetical protein
VKSRLHAGRAGADSVSCLVGWLEL